LPNEALNIDNSPAQDSTYLITSGAVYKAISEITPVIEIQQIDNGHKIILTSVNGTEDFIIQNGVDGAKGDKGDKGDTPIKGTDYYTEADKTEIINAVIAALPVAEGGSY
jgi:hypothetical protein